MFFGRQNFGLICLFVILAQSGFCQSKPSNQNQPAQPKPTVTPTAPPRPKEEQSNMNILINKVLEKDPSATLVARQAGSSASSSLIPLTENSDPIVREIALRCLNESGGPGIAKVFAKALFDEAPTTRMAALAGLQRHYESSAYPQVLAAYDKSEDPSLRQQLALLIGKVPEGQPSDLRQRYAQEKDSLAREGIITALARLGDAQARNEFDMRLRNSRDRERKRFLEYAEYISQTWVVAALAAVLNDKTPILRIGVDGLPGAVPEYLRACDIAVNLIAKISGATFSFPVNGRTNYSDAQLQEVRQVAMRF